MKSPGKPAGQWKARRWFGTAGFVAASLFVMGRVALEPLRSLPHFDAGSMEDFAAIESFKLRQVPDPPELAFFGSSIGHWAVIPEVIARELREPPEVVRNLAIPGGTPFDLWNLIRRNPAKFSALRVAAIEVNPVMLKWNKENESRLRVSISQHATLAERRRLAMGAESSLQTAEWLLPLNSVRRPLRTVVLNLVGPETRRAVFPIIDRWVYPMADWYSANAGIKKTDRVRVTADVAARRLVIGWHVSKFQDHALRNVLRWLVERNIPVAMHQAPVHPEVADLLRTNPVYAKGYASYLRYLDSLQPAPDAMIRMLHPAGCGVSTEGLADRTHLNEIGATAYSRFLADKIRSLIRAEGGK